MSKAMVILSGGQDSTYCLGLAIQRHGAENVYAITFHYGQRHSREVEAAAKVAELLGLNGARHEVVDVQGLLESTSPLVDHDAELEQYASPEEMERIIGDRVEKTFVPMRNAFFLTVAANRAAAKGCEHLYTGVCEDDNANYPDCREAFIGAQEHAINAALGTFAHITIETPLMHMSKEQQCLEGTKVPGVYHAWAYSHTAYDGQYPPTGADHATVLRADSFDKAGIPDPLVARAVFEGRMDVPHSDNYDCIRGDHPAVQSLPVLVAYVTEGQG